MEKESFKKNHIEHSFEVLEDLRLLETTGLEAVIGRLHYHLTELTKQKEGFKYQKEFTRKCEKDLERELREIFFRTTEVSHFNFYIQNKTSIDLWMKWFQLASPALGLTRQIPWTDEMRVSLEGGRIKFSGFIQTGVDFKQIRPMAYKLTRLLLKKNSLLTYKVYEKRGKAFLELCFDFAHDMESFYLFRSPTLSASFALPWVFYDYQSSVPEYDHPVIVISRDFKVSKYKRVPKELKNLKQNMTMIHLDFLFRPLSIIIESSGEVVSREILPLRLNTGSEQFSGNAQDESKAFQYIDIFSLIYS